MPTEAKAYESKVSFSEYNDSHGASYRCEARYTSTNNEDSKDI